MAVMDVAVAAGFTRSDRDALPEDGNRHELIDGAFFVTPSPGLAHRDIVLELAARLRSPVAASGLHVVVAPFDVTLSTATVVVPDIVVAPRTAFTAKDLPVAPVLAIEVQSPSTARMDRLVKREVYERAGIAGYWLVDPAGPRITVLELRDGRYVERGTAVSGATLAVTQPFAIELTPADWWQRE